MTWSCVAYVKKYRQIQETDMIYKFLLGLNKELDEVRGRVFGTKSMPNLRQVFSKVRREESCRRVMLGTSASSTVEGSALATRFSSDPKPTGGPDLTWYSSKEDRQTMVRSLQTVRSHERYLPEDPWQTYGLETKLKREHNYK